MGATSGILIDNTITSQSLLFPFYSKELTHFSPCVVDFSHLILLALGHRTGEI
jgi:hypothetical protein